MGNLEKIQWLISFSLLVSKKSELFVFRHSYEEFLQIVESCLDWNDNNYYDPEKSQADHSKILRIWVVLQFEVKAFIAQIPFLLNKNKIKIVDTPDPKY